MFCLQVLFIKRDRKDNKRIMESPKKSQPKPSLSPQKSQKTDDELMVKPDIDLLSVSRGGRVRKAKVVFDPSEYKRRSMPNMEPLKPKRPMKGTVSTVEAQEEVNDSAESNEEEQTFKSVASIAKRRKTISVAVFESDGCMVCFRADIKKGRFVNCIGMGCKKRGHFTCLRNDKLFKTADSETGWQCPTCKVCKACLTAKTTVSIIWGFLPCQRGFLKEIPGNNETKFCFASLSVIGPTVQMHFML